MYNYLIVSDTYLVQVALCIGLFETGAVLCIQDQLQRELARRCVRKGGLERAINLTRLSDELKDRYKHT
jgi:hypothetical protein